MTAGGSSNKFKSVKQVIKTNGTRIGGNVVSNGGNSKKGEEGSTYWKVYWTDKVTRKHPDWEEGILTLRTNRKMRLEDIDGGYLCNTFKPRRFKFEMDVEQRLAPYLGK